MRSFFSGLPFFWWVKFWLCLFCLVLSVAFTLPTFLGEPDTWPQWVRPFLPESKIALGLDLRGGVSLTLEVDAEGSIQQNVARSLNRARDLAAEKGIKVSPLEMTPNLSGSFTLEKPSEFPEFQALVSGQTALVTLEKPDAQGKVLMSASTERVEQYTKDLIQQAIHTIRNRIDQFGVTEPSIVQLGDRRISLQMPGLKDSARAKELIGSTAQLDFRLVLNDVPSETLPALIDEARKALSLSEKDLTHPSVLKIAQWLKDKSKIPRSSTLLFERPKVTMAGVPTDAELREARAYLVEDIPKLTGELIESASAVTSQSGVLPEAAVSLSFKPMGAKIFGELTTKAFDAKHAPHQIAIVLDGNIQSAPVVNQPILNGNAQITMGRGSDLNQQLQQAQDLALVLKSGALPATVKVIEERQVGPSEGQENIRTGLISSGIAAILVVVMMVWVYGNSGVVANIAMFFNVLCILGFLGAFGATLTLPGIAGIVLTMAVAVDGNVIINERIREEIRHGANPKLAFYKGYDSSFVTLVDAHVTSAVAGFVLLAYGNPAVKGFAVTLLCGIVSTLFTSYYVTEVMGQWLVEKTKIKRFS